MKECSTKQALQSSCEENVSVKAGQAEIELLNYVGCKTWFLMIIVKPKSEVQSPKVKTKRTWADTKITRLP